MGHMDLLEYLHPGWVLRALEPGPLPSYWDIWTCIRHTFTQDGFWGTFTQDGFWGTAPVPFSHIGSYGHIGQDVLIRVPSPSPRMGFEGLPRSPSVILGHMDMHSSTFTQDGFWGTASVPFGHIGTFAGPKMSFEGLPRSSSVIIIMDLHSSTFTQDGFEGLPWSPSVIFMDMYSSTFTQDGFWGTAPVPFGHNGTYGALVPLMGFGGWHAFEYLHPGWVLRDCPGPLRIYYDIRTYDEIKFLYTAGGLPMSIIIDWHW